jgi:hypothetical protein
VILAVDPGHAGARHEARICALLWSGDADPLLLASEHFRAVPEFKAWLIAQRARWLGTPITVQWSGPLIENAALVAAISEVLVGQTPPATTGELPPDPSALRRSY